VHVVIMGCGRVGAELTIQLAKAGHSVAIIDKRQEAFDRLPPGFDAKTIVGVGFDREILEEAGIKEADAFVAVSNGDNSNIVSARVAQEHFHVPKVVARIYDPRRAVIYQRLGISTVATVSWTTDQVMRRLLPGDQPHDWLDPSAKVCLVEHALPLAWGGKKLAPLNEPGCYWLTAVTRFGTAEIVTADLIGQEGDVLFFVADVNRLDALRERLEQGPQH
jgi:trk system potassium uptake protein TrkA